MWLYKTLLCYWNWKVFVNVQEPWRKHSWPSDPVLWHSFNHCKNIFLIHSCLKKTGGPTSILCRNCYSCSTYIIPTSGRILSLGSWCFFSSKLVAKIFQSVLYDVFPRLFGYSQSRVFALRQFDKNGRWWSNFDILCFNFSIPSKKRKMSFEFAALVEVLVAGTNIADESFCFKVDKTWKQICQLSEYLEGRRMFYIKELIWIEPSNS